MYSLNLKKITIATFYCFISILAFEGPLRYFLGKLELETLVYIKDFAIIINIILYIIITLKRGYCKKAFLYFIMFLSVFSVVSVFNGKSLPQIFFSIKMFLPVLLGFLLKEIFIDKINDITKFLMKIYCISIIGAIVNLFFTFPWTDSIAEILDIDIVMSSTFGSRGVIRYAGLTRNSGTFAMILLSISILYIINNNYSIYKKIIIWIVSGYFIYLSTSKAAIITYIIITFSIIIKSKTNLLKLNKFLISINAILPISTFIFNYENIYNKFSNIFTLNSIFDRLINTWPRAFELTEKSGNYFTGIGIGGIGVAQKYFENELYNPADNLFVYLYASCGIFAVYLTIYCYLRINKLYIDNSKNTMLISLLSIMVFAYGITYQSIENGVCAVFLGIIFSYMSEYKIKLKRGERNEYINKYNYANI